MIIIFPLGKLFLGVSWSIKLKDLRREMYFAKMAAKIQNGRRYSFKRLNIHLQGTQFVMKYVKTYVLRPKESFSDIFIYVRFQDGRQNSKWPPLFILPFKYRLAGATICHEVCQNLCFKAQGILF